MADASLIRDQVINIIYVLSSKRFIQFKVIGLMLNILFLIFFAKIKEKCDLSLSF